MDFKKYFLVLIAIVANVHVIESVTCRFYNTLALTYACGIDFQTIENEKEMLQIDGQHLSGKNNDQVEDLEAKESEIHIFPSLIIDQFINLRYVTLSNTRMKEISRPIKNCASLYYVYLDRNEFQHLPGGIFASCTKLSSIYIEYGKLRTIDANAFAGTNLNTVYLTGNQIEALHPSTFAVIPKLSSFYISNNMLSELPEEIFAYNPDLLYVVLDNNNLTSLPAKLLTNHTNLRTFSIDRNQISKINAETFANTPRLQSLFFDHNLIEDIPELSNLPELRYLPLFSNKIRAVNGEVFRNLTNLSFLSLSSNEIETASFPFEDPDYLPVLTVLLFTANNLTNITGMFNSLPVNLTGLDLSSNQLTYLQANSIRPMSQLRYLRLSYNQIKKVDPEFFRGAKNLTVDFVQNDCIDTSFDIENDLQLNTTIAKLLEKCYNSGQKARVGAAFLAISVFISFTTKFV